MDLVVILIIFVAGMALAVWTINRRMKSLTKGEDSSAMQLMNQNLQGMQARLDETTKTIHEKLDRQTQSVTQTISTQLSESNKTAREVAERLARLNEMNRQQITSLEQLKKLEDILKNPKQRGMFGEFQLEQLLSQAFHPKQYKMQYRFKDGIIADAILYFSDKMIPIDSKFSLENYNRIVEEHDPTNRSKLEEAFRRDLKNRIDETSKYIRPSEGTMDFAFMFIPAEGIYYDLLINKVGAVKVNTRDLFEYAIHDRKVHIVSPTTFYVTLQALMVGMNAYKIQESTKQIIDNVGVLRKHLDAYEQYFTRLGNNLSTTVNAYNLADKEFGKINKDVVKLTGGESTVEPMQLEKPNTE